MNKAPFTLTATVPSSWVAVGGGREGKSVESGGWTTKTWNEPNPVAMYLVPFAVDHFSVFRSTLPSGTPVVSAFAPDAGSGNAEARLPEILTFLESKLGTYPHVAAGGIFADPIREDIAFSALETQTRPYYTFSRDVEDDKRLAVVVHENTHEWYGDVVSVEQWRDICLNECFASYLPWMWSEEKEGKSIDKHYRETVEKIWDDDKVWGNLLYDMCPGVRNAQRMRCSTRWGSTARDRWLCMCCGAPSGIRRFWRSCVPGRPCTSGATRPGRSSRRMCRR